MYFPIGRSWTGTKASGATTLFILNAFILLALSPPFGALSANKPKFEHQVEYKHAASLLKLTPIDNSTIEVELNLEVDSDNYEKYLHQNASLTILYRPQKVEYCGLESSQSSDIDADCLNNVEWFGYFDDEVDTTCSSFQDFCAPKAIELPIPVSSYKHNITSLLSNVSYLVKISVNWHDTSVEFENKCATTLPGTPLYPPQTDISSFQILGHNAVLFWRPLPELLLGKFNTKYGLVCFNNLKKIVDKTFSYTETSHIIEVESNLSYNCHIDAFLNRSNNEFSLRQSLIYIPQESLIYDEHIYLQVWKQSANKYDLQWIDMKDKISSLDSQLNISDSFYTIYWCQSINTTCTKIEGMKKTHENHTKIIFNQQDSANRLFGISFSSPQSGFSSGISWMNYCESRKLNSSFSNITKMRSDPTGTKLILTWIEYCDTVKSQAAGYDFEVCQTTQEINECRDYESDSFEEYNYSTLENIKCHHFYLSRDEAHNEAVFTELSPAYLYTAKMKIRFLIESPYIDYYTNIKLASTVNPHCLRPPKSILVPLIILLTIAFLGSISIAWLHKQYERYRNANRTLTRVLDDILDRESNVVDLEYEYYNNMASTDARNTITIPTSTATLESRKEHSTSIGSSNFYAELTTPANDTKK